MKLKIFKILFALAAFYALPAFALQVDFVGNTKEVITIVPEKSTGLEMIYVAYDCSEIREMCVKGISNVSGVYRYKNLGGGFAEPISYQTVDSEIVISSPEGDMGYIIEAEGRNIPFWIVDYLPHRLSLISIAADPSQDCTNTRIDIQGDGAPIHYFTLDGRQAELSRDISLDYHNLEWDNNNEQFIQSVSKKTISHISNPVILTPPLYCNTVIAVSGDRFLEKWGIGIKVDSPLIYANGIDVRTSAEQTNLPEEDPDLASNLIKTETNGMGGSAPADISFKAYVTDAVVHNEWQIASDAEFEYIDYRFNEQNLDYTFNDEGTYFVRFVGSNSDGSCEAAGETYTVSIGASDLRIPNAFTPNGDGINDIWRVAYRSLLSFSCTIFDRYGNEIYSFNDPTGGWDGKYKGKNVKPGVYFYVIEAEGADGTKYKKGGDINILKSNRESGTNND